MRRKYGQLFLIVVPLIFILFLFFTFHDDGKYRVHRFFFLSEYNTIEFPTFNMAKSDTIEYSFSNYMSLGHKTTLNLRLHSRDPFPIAAVSTWLTITVYTNNDSIYYSKAGCINSQTTRIKALGTCLLPLNSEWPLFTRSRMCFIANASPCPIDINELTSTYRIEDNFGPVRTRWFNKIRIIVYNVTPLGFPLECNLSLESSWKNL